MKKNLFKQSIKAKITVWYTSVILMVLFVALAGAFRTSENYSIDAMHEELIDEVGDLKEDISNYPTYFPEIDLMAYYDDGVMLSIYDSHGNMVNGIIPDDFPEDYKFDGTMIHELSQGEDHWFIYDKKVENLEGTYWIRGIHSYSAIAIMAKRLMNWVLILIPVLIFFTAFVGYRMLSRSFRPVKKMTETVNEITSSMNLSLRVQEPEKKDEIYELATTFNQMLSQMDNQLIHEKQFTSDAAHELRTPVSVILSQCEYMQHHYKGNEKIEQDLEIIYNKAQYMSQLIDMLLIISRTERPTFKLNQDEVDLAVLAETVLEEMEEEAAKKEITLQLLNHIDNTEFVGDMTLLVQLFTNLISNAIKYGKENGHLYVTLKEDTGLYHITFEDDGIGIPKESLNRIWERFYQVEDSRSGEKGFGLGLFLVQKIVQLHKGSISVSSTLGKGTVFTIILPKNYTF